MFGNSLIVDGPVTGYGNPGKPELSRTLPNPGARFGGSWDKRSAPHPIGQRTGMAANVARDTVSISPSHAVQRRTITTNGLWAEFIRSTTLERIEHVFHAPVHLLVAYEKGERKTGETYVEGVPLSTRRNVARKLTFVPAGHKYREWLEPRAHIRLAFFYFNPTNPHLQFGSNAAELRLPRVFFEDESLWDTVLKLKGAAEGAAAPDSVYFEALGSVLIHELARLNRGAQAIKPPIQGGLASWQQRAVSSYIDAHLAEPISMVTLADLARLSSCHFSRAFKRSFGMPPHRFHNHLRIERARGMLEKSECSITELGLSLGFSETSSFSTAFRKAVGLTPTAYRRSRAQDREHSVVRD